MTEKLFHVGIKALIEDADGKILVMKTIVFSKSAAHWDIPGGRVQVDETAEETLRREVEEETGITEVLSSKFYTTVISNIEIPISETEKVGLVLMIYKVTIPVNSKVLLSPEHTDYEWVDSSEAKQRLAHKYSKEFTDLL